MASDDNSFFPDSGVTDPNVIAFLSYASFFYLATFFNILYLAAEVAVVALLVFVLKFRFTNSK